jgi:hypothetical protein
MKDALYLAHPLIIALKAEGILDAEILLFIQAIDESPYAINEWFEAWTIFEAWCLVQKRPLSAKQKFEYISCCAESARAGITLPLSFLLKEFLRTNGVE